MLHVRLPPLQRQFWMRLSLRNERQLQRVQQKQNELLRRHEKQPLMQPWQQI
jgi:hypothetical protein